MCFRGDLWFSRKNSSFSQFCSRLGIKRQGHFRWHISYNYLTPVNMFVFGYYWFYFRHLLSYFIPEIIPMIPDDHLLWYRGICDALRKQTLIWLSFIICDEDFTCNIWMMVSLNMELTNFEILQATFSWKDAKERELWGSLICPSLSNSRGKTHLIFERLWWGENKTK